MKSTLSTSASISGASQLQRKFAITSKMASSVSQTLSCVSENTVTVERSRQTYIIDDLGYCIKVPKDFFEPLAAYGLNDLD